MSRRPAFVAAVAVLCVLVPLTGSVAAGTSSCPSDFDSGFSDVAYSGEVSAAVSCLVYYGVTKGTTPTTYSPGESVLRWQMAVFLTRQLEVHGVVLPSAAQYGFEDLGGLSSEAVDSINRIARLGIAKGTSQHTFAPREPVTRWQMALFLKRSLVVIGVPVPTAVESAFTDLDGLSPEAVTAIGQLAEMGIASGFTDTEFGPFRNVLRSQMALFLSRVIEIDGLDPGRFGYLTAFDKVGDTIDFGSPGGGFAVSNLPYDEGYGRWRVNGAFSTSSAAFESHLSLGDRIVWRGLDNELWLEDRPFSGTPTTRTDSGLLALTLAEGVISPLVNYQASNLTGQLGLKAGAGGAVTYRVNGSGASERNLGQWESEVDHIISGDQFGTVSVGLEGRDIVWTVATR